MFSFLLLWLQVYVVSGIHKIGAEQDWWEKAIFYQIYPMSFKDSDGDGIGDINGISEKLFYLRSLGVGAIWLSPIFKSPMHDSGNDVSDFYAIQEDLGTMEDFAKLVRKAKYHDIKVLLDIPANHCSNESEWFLKSLSGDEFYRDWFTWGQPFIDDTGHRRPPSNWLSVFGKSAWEYKSERDQFYLHQFKSFQPDLNYRNPAVSNEIKNVLQFWLNKGVAGFKMDAVDHLLEIDKGAFANFPDEPPSGRSCHNLKDYDYLDHIYTRNGIDNYDMVYQWREVLDDYKRRDGLSRVLIVEASTDIKRTVKFYRDGTREGAHIPINNGLIIDFDRTLDSRDLKHITDRWLTYKPRTKPANWVTGNHNVKRISTRFRRFLVDAFNMLVLLLPGVAFTYQGEEIGMADGYVSWEDTQDPDALSTCNHLNYFNVSKDPSRTPFQWSSNRSAGFSTSTNTWLPVASGYENLNAAEQRTNPTGRSHYHVYRALARLRSNPEFSFGDYESQAIGNDVFAFKRQYTSAITVVVMNLGRNVRDVDLTCFHGVSGQLEVQVSSLLSSRSKGQTLQADAIDLADGEALVLKA